MNATYTELSPTTHKYRFIFISILLFLTIDIGVLIPNFILSSEIKNDTIGINLAGRQRMLSQRTAKALLQIHQIQTLSSTDELQSLKKELNLAYQMFNDTLTAFDSGGMVINGNNHPIYFHPLKSDQARQLVEKAIDIWQPYKQRLHPILTQNQPSSLELEQAVKYAKQNNLKLLDLMNHLTSELEKLANAKANTIQLIQGIGLILVSLNLLILIFHVLRKLQKSDDKLLHANDEIQKLNQQLLTENQQMRLELAASHQIQHSLSQEVSELKPNFDHLEGQQLHEMIVTMQRKLREAYLSLHQRQQVTERLNQELQQALHEIHQVMQAAAQGDFSQRLHEQNKHGLFLEIVQQINILLESNQVLIQELSSIFESVAQGHLTPRLSQQYVGTMEQLKFNINSTISILTQVVTDIKQITTIVDDGSDNLLENHRKLRHCSAEEINYIQTTMQLLGEERQILQESSQSIQTTTVLMQQTFEYVEQGEHVIGEAVTAINTIHQSSQAITEIISVINEIAFQTNLLALNAAVEAARAGEHGRGFKVVATEVQRLALRSSEAVKEIRNLIQDTVDKVKIGVKLVHESGARLQAIQSAVSQTNEIIHKLSEAQQQHVSHIQNTHQVIAKLETMMQQNTRLVKQAVQSSEQMREQVEKLAKNVAFFNLD